MATKPQKKDKKIIEKKKFDIDNLLKEQGLDSTVTEKELRWIPLSEAFHEAVKVPGIPLGYFVSFRGYSNTGKSILMTEGLAAELWTSY